MIPDTVALMPLAQAQALADANNATDGSWTYAPVQVSEGRYIVAIIDEAGDCIGAL